MTGISTGRKNAVITAIMFCASALTAILCCGCDGYGLGEAFVKERTFTVSFDANGGTPTKIDPVKVIQGEEWRSSSHWPSTFYAGYTFVGWFDGDGVQYTSDTKITKDVTLTARWTANVYTGSSVTIGTQTWMDRNLNHKTFNSWCYGGNNSNCDKYGRLYTWEAAMTACPIGWKLPTRGDWNTLVTYVGGSSTGGKALKSTSGWNDSGNGTDQHGFSALPGGYRNSGGYFDVAGGCGHWWSATEDGTNDAYLWYVYDFSDHVNESTSNKSHGYSVRCVAVAQD